MIQKFRWRFIIISILSLALVLFVSIGGIVLFNFHQAHNESQRVLDTLVQNDGQLTPNNFQGAFDKQESFISGRYNPESIYQYRHFSVAEDNNGKIIVINNQRIYGVKKSTIIETSKKALNQKQAEGIKRINGNDYLYKISRNQMGGKMITFLNISLVYQRAWSLLRLATLLGLAALLFFAIILIIFSKKAIQPIINAHQKQQQFITNAGHELKTPLAIISANTEMEEMLGNESEWTESTKEQTKRLTALVNNLIAMARLGETGQIALSKVDFSKIVTNTAKSFSSIMKQKDLIYHINIQSGINVLAEEKTLTELLNILIDNAQKYCDKDGQVNVTLRRGTWNQHAYLTVANSYSEGKDIDYSKFFDRFYREDESHHNQNTQSGYGIGLSMAQGLVKAYKGKINVGYKNNQIIFTVSLKLAK
ncbi:HAMP domain-containing sensor histidine kinase [Lactobacillus hamsteri]|uniref:histidine kinase n=1 Tax=Lactobacillus hamsteri DSM 5661 = JCM 6256 TaxID=1423754 RepID=A0A0R1YFM2_9LACO|nr:HAMP domain-containing sensor histidine kinase [Lactobacillus hamsteri]KRM41304.1 histidine protein kinase [Lactobacillus hamsteri DSM 5661 = JCM 6256]